MKKLVIAIDCDDVLVESTTHLVFVYNRTYGTHIKLKNAHTANNPEYEASREEVHIRLNKIQASEDYIEVVPGKQVIKAIALLAKYHDLHMVTARPDEVTKITHCMVESYFPGAFTSIEHVGPNGNKGDICRRLKADVIIDDNIKHLRTAQISGVKHVLWFGDYEWQDAEAIKDMSGVTRCLNWKQVVEVIDGIAKS